MKVQYFDMFFFGVAVTEGIEKATIEDETIDKKDRSLVKDKSAKLEAKLERENKKKMVILYYSCINDNKIQLFFFLSFFFLLI